MQLTAFNFSKNKILPHGGDTISQTNCFYKWLFFLKPSIHFVVILWNGDCTGTNSYKNNIL